jgi:hypothetical protein
MTCHPERPQGAKDLPRAFARNHSMEILRRFAPQNDMSHIGLYKHYMLMQQILSLSFPEAKLKEYLRSGSDGEFNPFVASGA